MTKHFSAGYAVGGLGLASVLVLCLQGPASAHHLMGLFKLGPSPLSGLLSGLMHPLLGPDHLLFLLAIGLVGLQQPRRWLLGLLVTGLAAAGLGIWLPGFPAAEPLVALSLVAVGLVLLERLPRWLLFPAMALHGYVLSATVIGWEPSPLLFYLIGLALGQGLLLLAAVGLVRPWAQHCSPAKLRLLAGILIGVGASFAWTSLVP
ncbi:MAG: HupE/UreJ family protein [Synechococcus lacustris]|jgi:urease accessory protein